MYNAIPEHLRGVFTTKRYAKNIHVYLTLPYKKLKPTPKLTGQLRTASRLHSDPELCEIVREWPKSYLHFFTTIYTARNQNLIFHI